jgi:uncharacterized protein YprB with RNaseH-like and TPR domain
MDTESTNLVAAFGHILCASFVDLDGEPYTFRLDRKKWSGKTKIDDSRLCVAIRDELEAADIIVGWNSKLHDIPLLNSRLAVAGERVCHLTEKNGTRHVDLMWYSAGQSHKIAGRKLDNISKFFGTEDNKTPLDGVAWQLAATGDKKAMDQVCVHCEADTLVLKQLWPHLASSISKFQFSLGEVWPFLGDIPSRKNPVRRAA